MTAAAPGARVCVTGGLGFVGSHLCHALHERGYEVLGVDSLTGAYAAGAGPAAEPDLRALGVSMVHADLTVDAIEPLIEGSHAVMHLGGLPGVRADHSPAQFWAHNALSTRRIAGALKPGQRLVLASSSSVYGEARRLPTPEDCAAAPLNPYAVSKLAAERECAGATGDIVIARLFTVFGPSQRPDMAFARWIDRIAHDRPVQWIAGAEARREFTYVDDAARGLIAALERGRPGEAYNVPGTGSTPVHEALEEIESLLGRRARLMRGPGFAEATATAACGQKARSELGYVPSVSLEEGLRRQVEAGVGAPATAA